MNSIKLVFAFAIVAVCSEFAASQCCCSGSEVTITDGAGFALPAKDIKVEKFAGSRGDIRTRTSADAPADAKFQFHVGCGSGKEALVIEYMGVEMRVRFILHGDFGHPTAHIVFAQGDYVAEFAKQREDEGGTRKIELRPAKAEEMKEIEPPATDASSDQTANSL